MRALSERAQARWPTANYNDRAQSIGSKIGVEISVLKIRAGNRAAQPSAKTQINEAFLQEEAEGAESPCSGRDVLQGSLRVSILFALIFLPSVRIRMTGTTQSLHYYPAKSCFLRKILLGDAA